MADEQQIEVSGGNNQLLPHATHAEQHIHYHQGEGAVQAAPLPKSVVILGAGADAAAGVPTSSRLIPGIVDWLSSEEGKAIDDILRKKLKRLTFSFDKFIDEAIDHLAQDLDRERETIRIKISEELERNPHLTAEQRKMGLLIVRIFQKITEVKNGAAIDEDTENLIREVTGLEPTDSTLIDFNRLSYTDTFRNVIVHILKQSLHDSESPILRHVYHNLLDIEQLMAKYFYGFYTNKQSYIKSYLYIAWMLWAYLVHCEQASSDPHPICSQLAGRDDIQVVTFNYTTYASEASPSALYFNGTLTDYIDIENKNDLRVDNLRELDLVTFFSDRLSQEMSLEGERIAIPIPSFMPPLKLKPVLSDRYISVWYRTSEAIRQAEQILVLGHSIHAAETFFCDMVRNNRQAEIILIDRDMESVARNLCRTLQLSEHRYTPMTIEGHDARKYDNRITIIQADLANLDLTPILLTFQRRYTPSAK